MRDQWEEDNREQELIPEGVPLLNGGPSLPRSDSDILPRNSVPTTTSASMPVGDVAIESTSMPSTPQVSSIGVEELRITTPRSACLPEEDP